MKQTNRSGWYDEGEVRRILLKAVFWTFFGTFAFCTGLTYVWTGRLAIGCG